MLSDELLNDLKNLKPFYKSKILCNIFSWKELENLLNFRPAITNSNFKPIKLIKEYKWEKAGWLTNNGCPADVINKIIQKHVCYIQDCSRINEKINNISKQLENTLNLPTDAHIYFSLKEKETDLTGFGKHKDTQHSIIVCVEGEFNIQIFENDIVTINKDMQFGDIVFIPAGFYHQVTPKTKRLSISFAMSPLLDFFQTREWVKI